MLFVLNKPVCEVWEEQQKNLKSEIVRILSMCSSVKASEARVHRSLWYGQCSKKKKTGWLIEPNIDFEKTQNYKIIESVCKQCLLLGSSILNSLCP